MQPEQPNAIEQQSEIDLGKIEFAVTKNYQDKEMFYVGILGPDIAFKYWPSELKLHILEGVIFFELAISSEATAYFKIIDYHPEFADLVRAEELTDRKLYLESIETCCGPYNYIVFETLRNEQKTLIAAQITEELYANLKILALKQ